MTDRRGFLLAGALAALVPQWVTAQSRQAKIGILAPQPLEQSAYAPGLVQRLAELGYREGAGARIHYRSADGLVERYPMLVEDLVERGCELFFALETEHPLRALRAARVHAPVVFLAADYDPVERGVISTMRTPDGNRTGVFIPQIQLAIRRVQFMREVVPDGRNFLLLTDPYSHGQVDAVRRAADGMRLDLTVVEFMKRPYDYAGAIDAGLKAEVEALIALSSPAFQADASVIAGLAARRRLPSAGDAAAMAHAGFLMTLGADVPRVSQRIAEIGARVLKGARTAEIPVEQADRFELVVNAAAARALGRQLPEPVMARADRVLS